jgi:hypothetical protein
MRDAGYEMRDAGYEMRDTGYEMRDTGYEMRDTVSFPSSVSNTPFESGRTTEYDEELPTIPHRIPRHLGHRSLWSMVYGLWSMVYGLWSMVYGLRSMVYGLRSMV